MFNLKCLIPSRAFHVVYIYLLSLVSADNYCDFGICREGEYCCGDNLCCKVTVQVWYFWAGILLIVIAILVAIYLCLGRWKNSNGYKRVRSDEKEPVL